MRTPDDIRIHRPPTPALAIFLDITGNMLRDMLQDLAVMTTESAWSDAITATMYMGEPRDFSLTHEQVETRLLDALDRLAEQIGHVHFVLDPVRAGRIRAQLDEVLGRAASPRKEQS